jgi:hypothetical protein
MLLAARVLGLGANLTTPYLDLLRRRPTPRWDCRWIGTATRSCRSGIQWVGSGRFAGSTSKKRQPCTFIDLRYWLVELRDLRQNPR